MNISLSIRNVVLSLSDSHLMRITNMEFSLFLIFSYLRHSILSTTERKSDCLRLRDIFCSHFLLTRDSPTNSKCCDPRQKKTTEKKRKTNINYGKEKKYTWNWFDLTKKRINIDNNSIESFPRMARDTLFLAFSFSRHFARRAASFFLLI